MVVGAEHDRGHRHTHAIPMCAGVRMCAGARASGRASERAHERARVRARAWVFVQGSEHSAVAQQSGESSSRMYVKV